MLMKCIRHYKKNQEYLFSHLPYKSILICPNLRSNITSNNKYLAISRSMIFFMQGGEMSRSGGYGDWRQRCRWKIRQVIWLVNYYSLYQVCVYPCFLLFTVSIALIDKLKLVICYIVSVSGVSYKWKRMFLWLQWWCKGGCIMEKILDFLQLLL